MRKKGEKSSSGEYFRILYTARFLKQFLTTLCVYTLAIYTYYYNVYITITRHLIEWAKSRAPLAGRQRN